MRHDGTRLKRSTNLATGRSYRRDASARREQLGRVFIAVKSVGDEVEGVNVHTHTQRQLTLKFLSPVGMTEAAGVRGDGDGLRQFLVETDYRTSWFATEGKGWHVQILYTHTQSKYYGTI